MFGIWQSRSNYWSCSPFADWLRKKANAPAKPSAGTSREWNDFKRDSKNHSEILYWLVEDGLDKAQNILYFPKDALSTLGYWVNNRFVSPSHLIQTGLTKGKYHETEERILFGMFQELVDFVEIQLAWRSLWNSDKKFVPWHQKVLILCNGDHNITE